MQIGTAALDFSVAISQTTGNNLLEDIAIPNLGIYPKDAQSDYKNMCSTLFIVPLLIIAKTWEQPKCPSTGEWIRKMGHIYTVVYYALEKNSDISKFADKWMDLENIILIEVT